MTDFLSSSWKNLSSTINSSTYPHTHTHSGIGEAINMHMIDTSAQLAGRARGHELNAQAEHAVATCIN